MTLRSPVPPCVRAYPVILAAMNLAAGILAPVLIVYLRQGGLTFFEVGVIASTLEAAMFLFEVPTGLIADRCGRRISVICCFFCFVVAGAVYLFSGTLSGFIAASALQGIGYTCISGALQAWAVDTLRAEALHDCTQDTIIAGAQCARGGVILGSITGGALGAVSMTINWTLYLLINAGLLVYSALAVVERGDQLSPPGGDGEGLRILNPERLFVAGAWRIGLVLLAVHSVGELSASPITEYWTVLFTENLGIGLSLVGPVLGLATGLQIAAMRPAAAFLDRYEAPCSLMLLNGLAVICAVILATTHRPVVAAMAFLGFKLALGVFQPLFESFLNGVVRSRHRATALSACNMAGAAGEIVGVIGVGAAADQLGLRAALVPAAICLAASLPLLQMVRRRTRPGTDREIPGYGDTEGP